MTDLPPLSIGEKVIWEGGSSALGSDVKIKPGTHHGKVCWVGKIKEIGSFWVAGIELAHQEWGTFSCVEATLKFDAWDEAAVNKCNYCRVKIYHVPLLKEKAVKGGGDGAWQTRHMFSSRVGHGLFLPAENLVRKSDLGSSKLGKSLPSSSPMQRTNKKAEHLATSEDVSHTTTTQNGPLNLKLSPAKGGTNVIKDTYISHSDSARVVGVHQDDTKQISNPSKSAKSNSLKRSVFDSLSRKAKDPHSSHPQNLTLAVAVQPPQKQSRSGILNLFKWFSRKENRTRKDSSQMNGKEGGSTSSLSDSSSITFFPIRHTVSADNSNAMMQGFNKNTSENIPSTQSSSKDCAGGACRRNSLVSLRSTSSIGSCTSRNKKRMAPQPPGQIKLKESSSACDIRLGTPLGKKSMERTTDQPIYGRIKRKAPLPPASRDNKMPGKGGSSSSSDASFRPVSTFSSFSSVSLSESSTLKSSTCSDNDSLTLKSDTSSQKTVPAFPLGSESQGPLSPKPWYKRKKSKSKEKVSKSSKKNKEIVYELWMPDIQYARKHVGTEPQNRSGTGNIEAFYDKESHRGQRFSILSSISDLDRAATEQLEREKAKRKASKSQLDQAFYSHSSPHMLSQEDLTPRVEAPVGAEAVVTEDQKIMTYDNLNYTDKNISNTPLSNTHVSNTPQKPSPSKDPPRKHLKPLPTHIPTNEISLFDDPLLTTEIYNKSEGCGKINYEEYIEEIRRELEAEALKDSEMQSSKSTPMQKAIFDSELFYQLAKDAKVTCESKLSSSVKQGRESTSSKPKTTDGGKTSSTEWANLNYRLKHQQKNFGLRMNNFYTPDVSTILEGSESLTSSNATTAPGEDIEDSFSRSLRSFDQMNDVMSQNSERRLNTFDLQDIIESFNLDLSRGSPGEDGDQAREGATGGVSRQQAKAEQIRDEVLLLRERDNFLMWQKSMQETELTREDDEVAIQERKKKWICDACTLINQPWRLHCEACGSLRPPNPRRVGSGEIQLGSPDAAGSYRSTSTASPMTVIHDDRNASELNHEALSFSEAGAAAQTPELRTNEAESALNTNWERELQSYFTLFDDHANALQRMESKAESQTRRNRELDETNVYGKINVSKPKQTNAPAGQGEYNINEADNLDVQEIRRARIRRFELSYSSSQDQQNLSSNPFPYSDLQEWMESTGGGVREKINLLSERASSTEPKPTRNPHDNSVQSTSVNEALSVFQNATDKKEQKVETKTKSPVLKPSGAVKSVISIFNQLDQLKAVQEKPPLAKVKKQRSITNILNFGDFERLFSGNSNDNTTTATARTTSPINADIDIASAICKFDEMAAMAEIDCLRKPAPKTQKKKFRPQVIYNGYQNHSEVMPTENAQNGIAGCFGDAGYTPESPGTPIRLRNGVNDDGSGRSRTENRDSCESLIKDGILYTAGESRRRRSMSIGSGTFELIAPKDFASIEAHHSRRPSPADEPDFPTMLELTHPLFNAEIALQLADGMTGGAFGQETPPEEHDIPPYDLRRRETPTSTREAVERLSLQLTEADGIASFKALLEDDETEVGDGTTKTLLSRLLKRLENAISSGQHAEAARLARDLAKMRLSTYVSTKPASDNYESTAAANSNGSPILENGLTPYRETTPATEYEAEKQQRVVGSKPTGDQVVMRPIRIDPTRREVKSDIMSRGFVINQSDEHEDIPINVQMYVEDKQTHQGPIPLLLHSSMTVGDLKVKVSEEFGFPIEVQRWILGRLLADDDFKTLFDHKVTSEGCPIFLYLVAPETADNDPASPKVSRSSSVKGDPRREAAEPVNHTPSTSHPKEHQERSPVVKPKLKESKGKKGTNEAKKKSKGNGKLATDVQKSSNEDKGAKESQRHVVKGKGKRGDGNAGKKRTDVPLLPSDERDAQQLPTENGSTVQPHSNVDGWVCPQCTLINPRERPGCEACATERPDGNSSSSRKTNLRQAVFALEEQGCVPNLESFDCTVCFMEVDVGEGVVLRDCLHWFCRVCLSNVVKYSETAAVKCPFSDKKYSCQFALQEREIKALLSEEDYKKHLDKSVKEAAGSMQNVYYCKTPDCKGFCQFEDNVNVFCCDVCRKANCLTCQAQHEGVTCKQYQDDLANKQDEEALKTKKFFDDIIRRGDGIPCPQCSVMLVRKWGCDWMRCPMCRTEICWVTRGPRWGPEGQGDTSGGCKCGINGRKCHPKCTYCH